jgi:hypothetical protein
VSLSKLDIEKAYFIAPYQDGFLAWTGSKNQAILYDSFGASGTVVNTPEQPKKDSFSLGGVVAYGTDVAFVYTDNPDAIRPSLDTAAGEDAHSEEFQEATSANKTLVSEVIMSKSGQATHNSFRAPASGISLCAKNRLCALNNGTLKVFDVSSNKARLAYQLRGIDAVDSNNHRTLLMRGEDVLIFDATTLSGYVSYRFGDYSFCGVQNNISSYTLCIVTSDNRRSAILIDPTQPNTDSIDQKLLELAKEPYVSSVSAYQNRINILPYVGEPVLNETTGHYEYSPDTIKTATDRINALIDKLGINRSAYSITSAIK